MFDLEFNNEDYQENNDKHFSHNEYHDASP